MKSATNEVFTAGLKLVIEALEERSNAKSTVRASVAELNSLCASIVPNKTLEDSVVEKGAKTPLRVDAQKPLQPSAPGPVRSGSQKPVFIFPAIPECGPEDASEEKVAALGNRVLSCTLCPQLAATRAHVVFGEGDVRADLMFVGEAPGIDEDREGRPFAGESGALLDKMLVAMGFSRGSVYLTTVLKCRPHTLAGQSESRTPDFEELSRCAPYLAAQISMVKPKVIVAMGAGAMSALFGSKEVVGKLRSRWHELQGIPVMPTFHPTYLIRNQSNTEKRKVWEDLLQVLEKLGCEISEKQRGFFKPRASA